MTGCVAVEGQCNAYCEAEQGTSREKYKLLFFLLCLSIYHYEQDCKDSPPDLFGPVRKLKIFMH